MLVTTEACSHLTSLVWVCVLWLPWKLNGAICAMKNFDQSKFLCDLYVISEIMSSLHNHVNICSNVFCEYLATVIEWHCPLKTKTIRHNNVPYINADLRKLQYQRNMMRNLKNTNPNPENFERYRILRNKCVKLRLSSKRKYFEQRCDGGP